MTQSRHTPRRRTGALVLAAALTVLGVSGGLGCGERVAKPGDVPAAVPPEPVGEAAMGTPAIDEPADAATASADPEAPSALFPGASERGERVLRAVCNEGAQMRAAAQVGANTAALFGIEEMTIAWDREDLAAEGASGFTLRKVKTLEALIDACGEPDRKTDGAGTDADTEAKKNIIETHWWGPDVGVGVDKAGNIVEVTIVAKPSKTE